VLGNDPKVARNVVNKVWLAEKLKKLGMPHPRIYKSKDDVPFPCVAKPVKGGGGVKNYLVKDASMLPEGDGYFFQEYVTGKPLSVSVLSTGKEAMPVCVNEILVAKNGWARAGSSAIAATSRRIIPGSGSRCSISPGN